MSSEELTILKSLKDVMQTFQQHEYHLKKLAKLHERLTVKGGQLSLNGAAKLFRAYEAALEGVLLQNAAVNLAKDKLDSWLEAQKVQIETTTRLEDLVEPSLQTQQVENELELERELEREQEQEQEQEREQEPEQEQEQEREREQEQEQEQEQEKASERELSIASEDSILLEGVDSNDKSIILEVKGEIQSPLVNDELVNVNAQGAEITLDIEEAIVKTVTSTPPPPEPNPKANLSMEKLKAGTPVAVLCKVDNNSPQEDWILATILRPVEEDSYEVEDVEFDDPSMPASSLGSSPAKNRSTIRFTVSTEKIRLLPLNDTESGSEVESFIRPRQKVLALFPGTTCLYPATVISTPARRKKTRDYMVKFSDDTVAARPVPPRYVLPLGE